MLARDLALGYTQSHPILELVAETVRNRLTDRRLHVPRHETPVFDRVANDS